MSLINLEGTKFARLTVISFSHIDPKKRAAIWYCICDCGKEHLVKGTNLRSGQVKSCGCLRKDSLSQITPPMFQDLSGQVFGRLIVVRRVPNRYKNHVSWLCTCACGIEKVVCTENLKSGRQVSCGCLNRERATQERISHALSGSYLYRVWGGMITRCYNEKCKAYKHYGGRGIRMSDEWRNSFIAFYNDMQDGYRTGLQLDRINVNGNYERINCRWATPQENGRNKRNTIYITANGQTKPLLDWADEVGGNKRVLYERFWRGLDGEEIIRTTARFDASRMILK